MDKTGSENIDRLGIFLSLSCCIHCLVTPFLLIVAPGLGEYFENELVHVILFALVAPIALFSFISTYKQNGHKRPLIFGSIGLFGLFIGMLIHTVFEGTSVNHGHGHIALHQIEIVVNILSGLIMIYAHIINFKERECKAC
jgi:hypothetical protein